MRIAYLAAALAAASALPAVAHADPLCPSGNYSQVRTSELIPGGTIEGFKKALAAHAKWYADHGYTADKFAWGQVIERDPATKKPTLSATKFVTYHFHASDITQAKQDAGWDAFVAIYKANSKITSSALVCMGG